MGVNWIVLGLAIGAAAIILALSIYILLYWSRPSDKWVEIPSRILVVFSLFFLFMLPIVIPFDRANSLDFTASSSPPPPTSKRGIDPDIMKHIWTGLMLFAIFLAAFLLPLGYFYISTREGGEKVGRSFLSGLWKAAIIIAATLILSALLWWLLGSKGNNSSSPIPIYTYFIVFACFLGSIIFTLFLSVGLFIYPVSYIIKFVKRPHSLNKDQLLSFKQSFKQKSHELLQEYDRIYGLLVKEYSQDRVEKMIKANERNALFSRSSLRKEARNFEKLERDLNEMEKEYIDTLAMNIKETANPLKYYLLLALGIFFLILSLLWYIQIIAAVAAKFYILDKAFTAMDKALSYHMTCPILSMIFYTSFAIYMIFCFVNGVTILGLKFVFFMKIYPMERNNTPLVGFLFNSMMMCVGSIPSVLFLTTIMSEYSKDSGVYKLFIDTVSKAYIFNWWFTNMYWFIVVLAPVTMALWVTYIFVQCKHCKLRKRGSVEENKKDKKGKEDGLMNMFGSNDNGGIPSKGAMIMSVAKNVIGLNN